VKGDPAYSDDHPGIGGPEISVHQHDYPATSVTTMTKTELMAANRRKRLIYNAPGRESNRTRERCRWATAHACGGRYRARFVDGRRPSRARLLSRRRDGRTRDHTSVPAGASARSPTRLPRNCPCSFGETIGNLRMCPIGPEPATAPFGHAATSDGGGWNGRRAVNHTGLCGSAVQSPFDPPTEMPEPTRSRRTGWSGEAGNGGTPLHRNRCTTSPV
jgi:hypothetical protein